MPRPTPSPVLATFAAATLLASGCRPRHNGEDTNGSRAANVDSTWLIAASSCWPDLTRSNLSLLEVKQYLADPQHFRAAFVTYAARNDASLEQIAQAPVKAAPAPDASALSAATTPVLTRDQAVHRSVGEAATVTNGSGAPPDALCAIQHGTPVGFR